MDNMAHGLHLRRGWALLPGAFCARETVMLQYLFGHRPKPGTEPGLLIDPPQGRAGVQVVHRVDFGGDKAVAERREDSLSAALQQPAAPEHRLRWLHIEGEISAAELAELGRAFTLHPLALEDVLNYGQRPKLDAYRDSVFATLALPIVDDDALRFEQVSVFIGRDFVLSFHSGARDIFAPVRERVRNAQGRLARAESDYLAYCLADMVVDTSFTLLAGYNDRLETLEDDVFEARRRDLIGVIHALRRELIAIRKVLRSQSEMLLHWVSLDHPVIHPENRPYFRDVDDHARRVIDLADGYYDTSASLLDTHLSLASTRLNEIMGLLTLIATIFMPLSFIAGVYGMNFDTDSPWNMPELTWRFGYPIVLGVMLLIALTMLFFFKRRRWL